MVTASSKSTDAVAVALSFGVVSFCRFCFGTVLALADTSLRGFRARFASMIVIGRIEDRKSFNNGTET